MLLGQPKTLAATLICYVSIALTLTSLCEAKEYVDLQRRDHNRLIKKRSPQGPVTGAPSTTPSAVSLPPTSTPSSSRSVAPVSSAASSPVSSAQPSSESSATSSSASTSSRSLSSLSTLTPTLPPNIRTTAPSTRGPLTFITSTTVDAPEPSESSAPSSGSMSKTSKTVITILIAIAASVGGMAIIWTIIRKWKLNKSDNFEDRMQPIDWEPTMGHDNGLPVHHRTSVASSFHSGAGHHDANVTGYGEAYGSADHNHGAAELGPLPDHDFTAGTANQHFAPVGGYADLSRGAGPDQMQETYRHGPVAYGGYTTHDAYDYSGGAGARY